MVHARGRRSAQGLKPTADRQIRLWVYCSNWAYSRARRRRNDTITTMPTKRPTPGKNSAHAQRSPRQSTRRGTSASYRPRAAHATHTPTVRVAEGRSEQGIKVPAPGGGQVLLTRRHFLYGAIGIGALAVVGGGIGVGVNAASKANEPTFNTLTVSKDAVTSCSAATPGDFTEI